MCGSSSWIIPAGLSLPYVWRLCQCLRTWKDTGNTGQAFNALKYSTAFPVIILSAVNFQVSDQDWNKFWKPLWLAAAFLNSGYSYYWDIERDWEIAFFSSPSGTLTTAAIANQFIPEPNDPLFIQAVLWASADQCILGTCCGLLLSS